MAAPVVMAVDGTTACAGFNLALAGNLVIADRSAKFTMAYTTAGLTLNGGASFCPPLGWNAPRAGIGSHQPRFDCWRR